MILFKEIENQLEKSKICEKIIRNLPEWFVIESYIKAYINDTANMPFYAVFYIDNPIGFIALKATSESAEEIYVLGVEKKYQHLGFGTQLVDWAVAYCKNKEKTFLTLKTLSENTNDSNYDKTLKFYKKYGFLELEEIKSYWDKDSHCVYMALIIK